MPGALLRMSHTPLLPASGGADPEPVEVVRRDAPHAFRVQERAVTEADYGTLLAERATGVQRASGRMRWTGSWYTAFVAVDREGGRAVDPAYRDEVARVLDRYRMAGVDMEVTGPRPVPLEVGLEVCARATRFAVGERPISTERSTSSGWRERILGKSHAG